MRAQHIYPLYGLPCVYCGFPAHHVEIYPNGQRVVHVDRRARPACEGARAMHGPAKKEPAAEAGAAFPRAVPHVVGSPAVIPARAV